MLVAAAAVAACTVSLIVLATSFYTPERTIESLLNAAEAGDVAAFRNTLTTGFSADVEDPHVLMDALSDALVTSDARRMTRRVTSLRESVLAFDDENVSLTVILVRRGVSWKVDGLIGSIEVPLTETIPPTEDLIETSALPLGTRIPITEGRAGSRVIVVERLIVGGALEESVLESSTLAPDEPSRSWIGTGRPSPYSGRVSRAASGALLNRSRWRVDSPTPVIPVSAREVAASFHIEPISSDMVFRLAWLRPDGTETTGQAVYPDRSWSKIDVGWWDEGVREGSWAAALLIDGQPASYVAFRVE